MKKTSNCYRCKQPIKSGDICKKCSLEMIDIVEEIKKGIHSNKKRE